MVLIFLTQLAIKRPFKFPPHPKCASALPGENGTHEIRVDMSKNVKKVPGVIGCNAKKNDQTLVVFGTGIPNATGQQTIVRVPTSPKVCFCTTCKKTTSEVCVEMNRKSSTISSLRICGPQQPWPLSVRLQCLRCHAAASLSDAV